MVSINKAHELAGLAGPARAEGLGEVWDGIKRTLTVAQDAKAPILSADLRSMVATLGDGLLGLRDRAVLTIGFAGAFRRSELVDVDVDDMREVRDGLEIVVRRSKTDQEGAGLLKAIPYGSRPETCPVRAYRDWIAAAGVSSGPVFRGVSRHEHVSPTRLTSQVVALVVKRAALAAGLDPGLYAGHSLRAGLVTQAKLAGKSDDAIMDQTGHTSTTMLRRYRRIRDRFADNAAAGIGL